MKQIIDLFFNQNLSTVDNIVIWINLIFASIAAYISYTASKEGILGMRNTFKLVSGLAWLYSFAYVVLLVSDVNFFAWSSIMRGVSVFAWSVVWTLPALMSIRLWKHLEKAVTENIHQSEADE